MLERILCCNARELGIFLPHNHCHFKFEVDLARELLSRFFRLLSEDVSHRTMEISSRGHKSGRTTRISNWKVDVVRIQLLILLLKECHVSCMVD